MPYGNEIIFTDVQRICLMQWHMMLTDIQRICLIQQNMMLRHSEYALCIEI